MIDFFDLNCFLLDPELSEKASEKHVRTWLEYRAGKGVEDPDASADARDFYQKIWKDLLEKSGLSLRPEANSFSENPDQYVQGDWMCSVATTFRKGLSLFVKDNRKLWESELRKLYRREIKLEEINDGVGGSNTYAKILLKDMKKERAEQKIRKFWGDEVLQKFIRSAYTPANLIIVPDGFNEARYPSTKDYWDLTLKKYYYQDKEPLDYTDRNDGKKYNVATPFRKLLKKNQEQGDPLCLSPWIGEQGKPLPLSPWINDQGKPNFSSYTYEENNAYWHKLMQEMTSRIDLRRELMAQYIEQLQNK